MRVARSTHLFGKVQLVHVERDLVAPPLEGDGASALHEAAVLRVYVANKGHVEQVGKVLGDEALEVVRRGEHPRAVLKVYDGRGIVAPKLGLLEYELDLEVVC